MILTLNVDALPVLKLKAPISRKLTVIALPSPGPTGPTGPTGNTGAAGSTDSMHMNVTQTAHGFAVGNILRVQNNATTYIKAKADTAANAEVIGIVSAVVDANTFTIITFGYVPSGLSGLTKGTVYFLSDATAGLLTATEPTPDNVKVSKPLLIANSATSGFFINGRGFIKSA